MLIVIIIIIFIIFCYLINTRANPPGIYNSLSYSRSLPLSLSSVLTVLLYNVKRPHVKSTAL